MNKLSNWEESRNEAPDYWDEETDETYCRKCEEIENHCFCKYGFKPMEGNCE